VQQWLLDHGVQPVFIAKASPQQNCYIKRFNGSMRRDLLNGEMFHSMLEAKVVIDARLELYNTRRPPRGIAGQTPIAYVRVSGHAQTMTTVRGTGERTRHHTRWTSSSAVDRPAARTWTVKALSHESDRP
jgi:hypothetical protein